MNACSGVVAAFNLQGAAWSRRLRKYELNDSQPDSLSAVIAPADIPRFKVGRKSNLVCLDEFTSYIWPSNSSMAVCICHCTHSACWAASKSCAERRPTDISTEMMQQTLRLGLYTRLLQLPSHFNPAVILVMHPLPFLRASSNLFEKKCPAPKGRLDLGTHNCARTEKG